MVLIKSITGGEVSATAKGMTKALYALIVGIWNSVSLYITQALQLEPTLMVLIVTIGNLVIVWIGTESGHSTKEKIAEP